MSTPTRRAQCTCIQATEVEGLSREPRLGPICSLKIGAGTGWETRFLTHRASLVRAGALDTQGPAPHVNAGDGRVAKVLTSNPGAASEDGAERCRVGTRWEAGFGRKSCHLPDCTEDCCDCCLPLVLAADGVLRCPLLHTTPGAMQRPGQEKKGGLRGLLPSSFPVILTISGPAKHPFHGVPKSPRHSAQPTYLLGTPLHSETTDLSDLTGSHRSLSGARFNHSTWFL